MLNLNLNLKLNELSCDTTAFEGIQTAQNKTGIAVIGIDAKVGSALTKEEIWQAFAQGFDMITQFPEERVEDAQCFSRITNSRNVKRFSQRAFLPWIDKFDPGVFKIAPTEAELMDPVQRMYLESAWSALEDAGYGGQRLYGSKTGVYVGYNNVGQGYDALLKDMPQETVGITLSGNVSSFLASRLSYLLNLTGPAMVIDTACSSSLVALHEACRALKAGDITTAVVGSIRIFFCPEDSGEDIGTTSSSDRTKTFDDSADGTGGGEGVINLVLKPLSSAIADKDHIYGVIKGSCANQDGSSIGITAPNSAAQEKAIMQAWKEADIHPEELSYIEAHGTATKLGDPVEIGGLTAAFSHFTEKKQFCAIGASKSNFGHLDCASGLLGVLKVLLMMQHKTLVPTIHFVSPNRKIDYIHSPIYINDTLKPWQTESGVLTAGVSSFGLSGTNCHVVLQSYETAEALPSSKCQLLTASAMEKDTLKELLQSYQRYLKNHPNTELEDFCSTLNTGRGQYRCRFAMVLENASDFTERSVEELLSKEFYHEFRIVADGVQTEDGLLTLAMQEELTQQAKANTELSQLAKLFLQGAQIDFSPLYAEKIRQKLSLPTYPFRHQRCWHTPSETTMNDTGKMHPLIDRCVARSRGVSIYEKKITLDTCMEIREHRINGVCVMPGTVYVEIAHAIGCDMFKNSAFTFVQVTFFSLMTCGENECRLLHAIVREENGELHISMSSCGDDDVWVDHIEAVLRKDHHLREPKQTDLEQLLAAYPTMYTQDSEEDSENFVKLGEHWQTGTKLYVDESSVVLCSEVGERFRNEAESYWLYPPMLDGSMNSGIMLLDGQYLPLNYKNMRFYGKLNDTAYSLIKRKNADEPTQEIALFEVQMFDKNGKRIADVEEYALKRVNQAESFLKNEVNDALWQIRWIEMQEQELAGKADRVILFLTLGQENLPFVKLAMQRYHEVVRLYLSNETRKIDDLTYSVSANDVEIENILRQFAPLSDTKLINLIPFSADTQDVAQDVKKKLQTNFFIAKALSSFAESKSYTLLTLNATAVTGAESCIYPMNQAVIGFTSCLESEQTNLEVCIIDADERTDSEILLAQVDVHSDKMVIAYRENRRYVEQMVSAQRAETSLSILDGDVIVIAGGYGGIGLALSSHIFSKCPNAKIVLLSRFGIKQDPRKERLEKMQKAGFNIEVVRADVSDHAQTEQALENIRKTYGRIDGTIIASGIAGDGMLVQKAWTSAENVLKAKIHATWNLHKLTLKDQLKYMILCSSFTSAVGAPGQTDYTAANAYLDAFTYERNRQGLRTMTINLTGWKESGMAKAFGVDPNNSFVRFVTDEEGKQLFEDAMYFGCERVIACELLDNLTALDAETLHRRLILPKGVMKIEEEIIVTQSAEAPIIYGKSPDKLTAVEQNIALAWARTLHVTEVNIYDKFFEAGGNSLLASYLQKEINRIYPEAMAITDVFVYSTVNDIAAYISGKLGLNAPQEESAPSDTNIEDLVQQFMSGKLSMEEMENLV